MAERCPECGTFMEYIGATSPDGAKWRANYWCPFDGVFLKRGLEGSGAFTGKVKRRDPELLSAYNEFAAYIGRDINAPQWNTVFFKMNDSSQLGVLIVSIMGVHEVQATRRGLYRFNVTTTSCNKIPFTYTSKTVAIRDRNRLIMKIKNYHASDAEDETIGSDPGGDIGSDPHPATATTRRTGTDGNEGDP